MYSHNRLTELFLDSFSVISFILAIGASLNDWYTAISIKVVG